MKKLFSLMTMAMLVISVLPAVFANSVGKVGIKDQGKIPGQQSNC